MSDMDHKNIDALRYLLMNFSKDALSTMKSLQISNEKIIEFPDFQIFSLFPNVASLTVTRCTFPSFPSKTIAQCMIKLTFINLESCNISSVKTLRPLGSLEFLKELNLLHNLILIDRSSTLKSLLYYNNKSLSVTQSKKHIQRAYTNSRLILERSKPAIVPRPPPFPMLSILNNDIIKEDEIDTIMPAVSSQSNPTHSDPILQKVKLKNTYILKHKEKFGNIYNTSEDFMIKTVRKPRVNTLEYVHNAKRSTGPIEKDECLSLSESEDQDIPLVEPPTIDHRRRLGTLVSPKEELRKLLQANKSIRDSASKPIPKKIYKFDEVSMFMYGKLVSESSQVHGVCEVMSIVNGVKKNFGPSETEIKLRVQENRKESIIDDLNTYQQISLLDDDMRNLRLKNSYFIWWLKKLEKRHLDFAQHTAVLAVHNNRIFNNPSLGTFKPKVAPRRRLTANAGALSGSKTNSISLRRPLLTEEEVTYVTMDFPGMFDPKEVKEGPSIFIKPILKFESILESLHNQLKEKEREYENLSLHDKVIWKLEKIKQNIRDREAVREKLTNLYDQTKKMKKRFLENEVEYFYNIHEKKLDLHEIIERHDFLQFELPKFIFPLIRD